MKISLWFISSLSAVNSLWAASHVPSAAYWSVGATSANGLPHHRRVTMSLPQILRRPRRLHRGGEQKASPLPAPGLLPPMATKGRRRSGCDCGRYNYSFHRPRETTRDGEGQVFFFLHFPATIRDMEALSDYNKRGRACMRCYGFHHRWKRDSIASPLMRYRFSHRSSVALN
jgi:hypothetical protein